MYAQDDINVPGCPVALGFTLEKLSAHTIDEAGKEVFVHKNALDLLRKVPDISSRYFFRLNLMLLLSNDVSGPFGHRRGRWQ